MPVGLGAFLLVAGDFDSLFMTYRFCMGRVLMTGIGSGGHRVRHPRERNRRGIGKQGNLDGETQQLGT